MPPPVITGVLGARERFRRQPGQGPGDQSIATLAYDCRRSDMFRGHLFDSLRLIERGDLRAAEMIGSWAGELGQTQMMPSEYLENAVDYDGDGKRNLIKSAAGRDRLDRQVPRAPRLETRRAVAAGSARASQRAVEGSRSHDPASALQVGELGRDLSRTARRCRTTTCRPRWCCRWAGSDRRSSPMTISRSI